MTASMRTRLRDLLAERPPLPAPGAYDALPSRLVAAAGFDGDPDSVLAGLSTFDAFTQVVGLSQVREAELRHT